MCTHIEQHAHFTTHIETYLYISQSCGSFASTLVLLSQLVSFKCSIAEKLKGLNIWQFNNNNMVILALFEYNNK